MRADRYRIKTERKTDRQTDIVIIILRTLSGRSDKIVKQESLANDKVNARQHCVSLSCLCNSLTQIEWVADFSLGDEDTKIGILDDHFLV